MKGNLITLANRGAFDVIIHGCNTLNIMGVGIARQIKKYFPEAYVADSYAYKNGLNCLGSISYSNVRHNIHVSTVVNAYIQKSVGTHTRQVDYQALRACFKETKTHFHGKRIGYPMIGAGLAGGDWNIISRIIDIELSGEDHTLVLYTPLGGQY